jgi:holo-[acyl-carrier protein] synthase
MRADLAGESGIGGFPWHRDDYGERMITLPGEVDGHRVRIGCDVMDIADVQDSLATFGDRYLRKVFTANEIDDCRGSNREHGLAARFAAKEAVIKAFAEPDMSFPLREIEVRRDGPLPVLSLSGTVAERAQRQGWLSSSLSLSHADCHAMAVVVVVCSPTVDDPTFTVIGTAAGAR